MSEELNVVGKNLPRWQAFEKVTGSARFTADFRLPGMLTGRLLTSPVAHANILNINTSKAEKLPGVEAVITFDDVPKKLFNPNKMDMCLFDPSGEFPDMYVLTDKVRFVGDKIAAVAAINSSVAEEALELIEVEFEELPAVFDSIEAANPGQPRIHDFAENNIALTFPCLANRGDAEEGFKEAHVVVEETFKSSKQHMCQMEPTTCVADFDASGRLTIWSMSQHPFLHRRKLAELFDMPVGMIRWKTLHIGGGWGKYGSFVAEPVCVVLAKKAGRPVKLEYSREEDFRTTETREAHIMTGKIGVRKDGTLCALQNKVVVQGGAYFTHNSNATNVAMGCFASLYTCPNIYEIADAVYTNIPVSGGCRGYGNPPAMCALEQLMDMAAEKLGMDPLELRMKNTKKAGEFGPANYALETSAFDDCLRLGAEKIGWKEKRGGRGEGLSRYGVGMAMFMHVSGSIGATQHRNVQLRFNEDGTVNLAAGCLDLGQNIHGTISQIAAEILGIRYEDIIIHTGDTDTTLFDQGMHASGGLYQAGNATIKGATELKRLLLERAAKVLEAHPEDLDVKDRWISVKGSPDKRLSVADVAKDAIYNFEDDHDHLTAKGSYSPEDNQPPVGASFAEVGVDTESGEVKVIKLVIVCDVGRAINPQTVESQLEGGASQGIGYALTEEYFINQQTGYLEADNYITYKIPGAADMPDMGIIQYEKPVSTGPFGAKGVGEAAMVPIAPAIANAVYDAVGVRITDLPITPEKILAQIKGK